MKNPATEVMLTFQALTPEAQEQAAAFIRALWADERHRRLTDAERRRLRVEGAGSMPPEDAKELIELAQAAHDERRQPCR